MEENKGNFGYFIGFVAVVIIIAEMIGIRGVKLGSISITILPLVFAVSIGMICGLKVFRKGIFKKVFSNENVEFAGRNMIFIMLPLMARYGADVAPKLREILSLGGVFLMQEFGNVGTVVIGLPVALLIGLRREAIGATLGIGREGELAYISEKYTLNSPEGRGVLSLYLIGTLFGTIFFSIIAPILLNLGYDFRALAMASGVGSASMMTASSSSLVATLGEANGEVIRSYAAASQLLTSFLGTYMMVFVAAPLQGKMYKVLTGGEK